MIIKVILNFEYEDADLPVCCFFWKNFAGCVLGCFFEAELELVAG